jgi:hypothetical protein
MQLEIVVNICGSEIGVAEATATDQITQCCFAAVKDFVETINVTHSSLFGGSH